MFMQRTTPSQQQRSRSRIAIIIGFVMFTHCAGVQSQTQKIQEAPALLTAPIERVGFRTATSYDTLRAFVADLGQRWIFQVTPLARSREGRTTWMIRVNTPATSDIGFPKLRVLIFAQQHGDEPAGKEALTMLLARCASGLLDEQLRTVELFIVPQMNPDGAEADRRRSGDGLDLNRSHVILNAPETFALHKAFLDLWPEVTMDLHEYGSSRAWTKAGFTKTGDVQLGMLTNLNIPAAIKAYQHSDVFPFIAGAMKARGFSFHEYIVGAPDEYLRHSTTEPNDGRQSFGMLGTMSFIQEGKNPGARDSLLQRRATSQLVSVEALVTFCAAHTETIRHMVKKEREQRAKSIGKPFVLRMNHFADGGTMQIPVRQVGTGLDTVWNVHPYLNVVRPLVTTTLPSAYVIPKEYAAMPFLAGYGIQSEVVKRSREVRVQVYGIDSVGYDVIEEDSIPHAYVHLIDTTVTVHEGDLIVRLDQPQTFMTASAFEPESMWGIAKYPEYESMIRRSHYPIMRIP